MSINKVIIPIAGLGTRFLPVTKVVPKEMLPISGKPILQLLVEEAVKAGITEVIFVINKEKELVIRDYFNPKTQTSQKIEEKGKREHLEELHTLIDNLTIHYEIQEEQHGDGHAILQAEKHCEGEDAVAVLFGDDLVMNTDPDAPNALEQLIKAYEKVKTSIIALEEVSPEEVHNYGIVETASEPESKDLYEIDDMVEKPSKEDAPSNLGVIGKYIITKETIEALHESKKGKDGEIRLIDGFKTLITSQNIHGLKVHGTRYDTGTLDGYRKAISEL